MERCGHFSIGQRSVAIVPVGATQIYVGRSRHPSWRLSSQPRIVGTALDAWARHSPRLARMVVEKCQRIAKGGSDMTQDTARNGYAHPETLVETEWVAQHLNDSQTRLI